MLLIFYFCRSRIIPSDCSNHLLIVQFNGDVGVDHGWLRMEFFTLVTQMTELILSGSHTDVGLPIEDLNHNLLFAAGVFIDTNRQRLTHQVSKRNIFFYCRRWNSPIF